MVVIGEVVHYVADGRCRAAIITSLVHGGPGIGVDSVDLCVIGPMGISFLLEVDYDAQLSPATWHLADHT